MPEYIDKEAFINRYRELHCKDCDHRKGMKNGKVRFVYGIGEAPCRACWIEDMIDCVDDWPAADVRENVRGEWIVVSGKCGKNIDGRTVKCPKCGNFLYMGGVNGGRGDANYCPNCGAAMSGGAEDD